MKAVPRHLLLRFLILVVLVATGFAILHWTPLAQYLDLKKVFALLKEVRAQLRETWWAPLALIVAYIVLCPFIPASPMMITGGFVFGPLWGSVYNVIGTLLGGTTTYFLGRGLGRGFVQHLVGPKLKRVERLIARRGFWGMVGIRFLPIPYPLVNYTAALAGIRPAFFMTTTAIGLIPGATVYTYFAALAGEAASGGLSRLSGIAGKFAVTSALLLLLTFIPQVWTARKRRERYRELCARRRARTLVTPSPAPLPPPAGRSAAPHP